MSGTTKTTMPLLNRPGARWKVRFVEPTEEANPAKGGFMIHDRTKPLIVQAHPDDDPLGEDGKGVLVPRGAVAVFEPEVVSLWTQDWPTEPGWYWFCNMDRRLRTRVEPAQMRHIGPPTSRSPMYARAGQIISPERYPNAWWHPMEPPPEPPTHASQEK